MLSATAIQYKIQCSGRRGFEFKGSTAVTDSKLVHLPHLLFCLATGGSTLIETLHFPIADHNKDAIPPGTGYPCANCCYVVGDLFVCAESQHFAMSTATYAELGLHPCLVVQD